MKTCTEISIEHTVFYLYQQHSY